MDRTIAIGDIHGCRDALVGLLNQIQPTTSDQLITLGDYVNRGPDSRGVLDSLIDLGSRCPLISILGNHDQAFLDVIEGLVDPAYFFNMGGGSTLDSYSLDRKRKIRASLFPASHLGFLRGSRNLFEIDTHFFAHASYLAEMPLDDQPVHVLRWESLRDYIPPPHPSGKKAVLGHSSQKSGEVLDLGHLVCIDTYCYGGGWLTALDVQSGRIWQVDRSGQSRPHSARG